MRRLVFIIAAAMVPAALVGTLLVGYDYYDRERTRLIRDSLATTRALAAAVDAEFAVVQAAMLTLAGSRWISDGDFRALHAQALELIEDLKARNRSSLINIILADPAGRQLFNTFRPYGEPLPASGDPGGLSRALQSDAPIVSDLFVGPVIKRPGIGVTVPVKRDGRNVYRLTAGVSTERLSALLKQQQLPEAWIAAVLDTRGTLVARTHDEARLVGQKGSPELVSRMKEVREDAFNTRTVDGVAVLTVFTHAPNSGYTVALGIPERELAASLFSSIARLFLVAFVVLLSALGLAVLLARRLLPRAGAPAYSSFGQSPSGSSTDASSSRGR